MLILREYVRKVFERVSSYLAISIAKEVVVHACVVLL